MAHSGFGFHEFINIIVDRCVSRVSVIIVPCSLGVVAIESGGVAFLVALVETSFHIVFRSPLLMSVLSRLAAAAMYLYLLHGCCCTETSQSMQRAYRFKVANLTSLRSLQNILLYKAVNSNQ